ncbi:MAG: hypothetical protein INR71_00130 [Terriglobus roseus]|nr:hypothetical protein [Terriglobus roseus]
MKKGVVEEKMAVLCSVDDEHDLGLDVQLAEGLTAVVQGSFIRGLSRRVAA